MPRRQGPGYIYIPNWDEFQHYKDRQPKWIKLHLSLMGSDAWLDLSPSDRCLLIGIWMCIGRYGNGAVRGDERWLKSQLNLKKGSLQRLNDAGFIRIRASKPVPKPHKPASAEKEGSNEPKEGERRDSAAPNGAAPTPEEAENQAAIARFRIVEEM